MAGRAQAHGCDGRGVSARLRPCQLKRFQIFLVQGASARAVFVSWEMIPTVYFVRFYGRSCLVWG